ncbi:hypothetical protein ACWGI0_23040 [Streptomyces sp. NPDC054802]
MTLTMTAPLAISWAVTVLTVIAHLTYWLPEHKAYGLYGVGLAAAAVHCLMVGSVTWGLLCIALTALCGVMWAFGPRPSTESGEGDA